MPSVSVWIKKGFAELPEMSVHGGGEAFRCSVQGVRAAGLEGNLILGLVCPQSLEREAKAAGGVGWTAC